MLRALLIVLALGAMALEPGAPALAVEEPGTYRTADHDAPVPQTLAGATVVDDDTAYRLWSEGRVHVVDVMPNLPRPRGLPADVIWRGRSRHSIPGATWLPLIGFGTLDAEAEAQFTDGLAAVTGGDKSAGLLFLCRDACWMSWNAARRALAHGYSTVYWYPDGSTGWTFWNWPTERLRPWKPGS